MFGSFQGSQMNEVGTGYPVSSRLPLYVLDSGTAGRLDPSATATIGTDRLEFPCAATPNLLKFGSKACTVMRISPSPFFTLPHFSCFKVPSGVFSSSLITGVGGAVLSVRTGRGPLIFSA